MLQQNHCSFKTKVLPLAFLVGDVGFGLRWAFQTLAQAAHHVMLFRKIHKVPAANISKWHLGSAVGHLKHHEKYQSNGFHLFQQNLSQRNGFKALFQKYGKVHPETVKRSGIGLAPQSLDVPFNSTQLALYCAFVWDQGRCNICRKRSLESSKHPSGRGQLLVSAVAPLNFKSRCKTVSRCVTRKKKI